MWSIIMYVWLVGVVIIILLEGIPFVQRALSQLADLNKKRWICISGDVERRIFKTKTCFDILVGFGLILGLALFWPLVAIIMAFGGDGESVW